MKKIVLIGIAFLFIAVIIIYLFIPPQIIIAETTTNEVSEINASRFLLQEKNWSKWWPGQKSTHESKSFIYNGLNYHFEQSTNSVVTILISGKADNFESNVTFLAQDNLKVRITWTVVLHSGNNLVKRIRQYQRVKQIKRDVSTILQHLKTFLENERNVYGINIRLSKVKDPIMLATSVINNRYPGMALIEALIQKLHKHIKDQNGLETNHPMLDINQVSKTQYQVMVAIPIKKEIKPGIGCFINKMVLGNILETYVKGGPNTIKYGLNELRMFSKDYRFTSPAMPFESMVTDRSMEKDTSKWITKIYYPIF
jgi:hypothetical protein